MAGIWPNEPVGAIVTSDWGFNTCNGGGWDLSCGVGIENDPTAPISPPQVMVYRYDNTTGFGGGELRILPFHRHLYMGIYHYLSDPFEGTSNGSNKLMNLKLDGESIEMYIKWQGPRGSGEFGPTFSFTSAQADIDSLRFSACAAIAATGSFHIADPDYPCIVRQWISSQNVPLGRYFLFECVIQQSTSLTSLDGRVRYWLDNNLILDLVNLNTPTAPFSELFFTPTWTPPIDVGRHADEMKWDHVRISTWDPTVVDIEPPTQVTNLSQQAGDGQVQLAWSPATDTGGSGLAGYIIGQSTVSGGPYTDIDVGNVTAYLVTGLTNNVPYYFQVHAYDGAGNHGLNSFEVTSTPIPGGTQTPVLTILPNGMFAINGVETYLLGVTYFDGTNWHASDIDYLTDHGFNLIRIIMDDINAGSFANSCFNSDGTLRPAKEQALRNLIIYCAGRGMIVDVTIMYADVDGSNSASWLTTSTARQAAITNACNAFKEYGNVFFDLVNEHNLGTAFRTHGTMTTLMGVARTAAPSSIIFYSSTDTASATVGDGGAHIWTSQFGNTVDATNVNAEVNSSNIDVIAPHNERNPGWETRGPGRVTTLRTHLNSIGQQNIPIYYQEDAREGSGGLGDAQLYIDYEEACRLNGLAAWIFHTAASFGLTTGSMISQMTAIELAVVDNIRVEPPPPILPTVTSVTTSATGAVISGTQDAGNPATAIRVCTDFGCTVEPISRFPGWPTNAVYTFTWLTGTTFACFHAQDAAGNEDPVNYQCNSVIPGGTDTTPPAAPTGLTIS